MHLCHSHKQDAMEKIKILIFYSTQNKGVLNLGAWSFIVVFSWE